MYSDNTQVKGVEFVIFCLQGLRQPQRTDMAFIPRPIYLCKVDIECIILNHLSL
ncbi:MAG: hypothetical protein JWO06_1183 [Bacteroidota bacterium]|nr:hypothetical protein [Bacteroidota bacterium]